MQRKRNGRERRVYLRTTHKCRPRQRAINCPLPWQRFLVFLALFITYPTLGFSLFSTLGYYSALGFFFCPPLVIILPLVFSSSHPWLLFSPRFSTFPILGYYSALGFPLFPSLGCYPALGLYSAGESNLGQNQDN